MVIGTYGKLGVANKPRLSELRIVNEVGPAHTTVATRGRQSYPRLTIANDSGGR
jgi:hypothetical protein